MESKKILIVEDDRTFVSLIKLALKGLNLIFDIAPDGRDALRKLSENQYHLLITDYRLPEIHGLDILRLAEKINPNCQTILISATDAKTISINLDDFNLIGFLQKPLVPNQLRELVTKALQVTP